MEEDNFVFTTLNDKVVIKPGVLDDMAFEAVAHFIMMHHDELGKTEKQRKRYKPKTGTYNLNAGLRKFGDRGEMAVTKELHQFNGYDVFEPLYADSLTDNEKSNALASLIFFEGETERRHQSKILCKRECSTRACGKR